MRTAQNLNQWEALDAGQVERIQASLAKLRHAVAVAAGRAGRDPAEVTIVAVSKTFGIPHIEAAARGGVLHFGENKVQEAEAKIPSAPAGLTWHMVGHLQRNKAKIAARIFSIVESVDSLKLARALNADAADGYPVLVQVNLSGDPDQHGVAPEALFELARAMGAETGLRLDGLMTIAPFVEDVTVVRSSFARLRDLRDRLRDSIPDQPWTHLSMGMTNDFELAIEEGATMVRIGRAIFGERG